MGQFRNNYDNNDGDVFGLLVMVICFGLIGACLIFMQVAMLKGMPYFHLLR